MNQYAIIICADASNGSDESLGRVLNALVVANDLQERGDKVGIFFQGAGTRSINILENPEHPGHGLYKNVKGCIKGASKACAAVFQADVKTVHLLDEFQIPGIGGATSLAKYIKEGYHPLTF